MNIKAILGAALIAAGLFVAPTAVTHLQAQGVVLQSSGTTPAAAPPSATTANGTTGATVPSSGVMGFDGTSYRRLATDTSGRLVAMQYLAATSTNLAAAGFLGDANVFDMGTTGTAAFSKLNVTFSSNQAGTYNVQTSPDFTIWHTLEAGALAAGVPITRSYPITGRWVRGYFQNGATIATQAFVGTSVTAN